MKEIIENFELGLCILLGMKFVKIEVLQKKDL